MMKLSFRPPCLPYGLLLASAFSVAIWPAHADQIKANNNNPLESGSSWVSSIAPAGNEIAVWNSTIVTAVNCTNTLGSAVDWGGIVISNPTAQIYINAIVALTLSINAAGDSANLSAVTSGQTTANKTTTKLGIFSVPSTGDWQKYAWVPLKNGSGNPVQITNDGSMKTWRVTTDNGNYNANFYILIPVYTPPASIALRVSTGGANGNIGISFPTQPGYGYQVEYKTNLTDAENRFYRVQIQ